MGGSDTTFCCFLGVGVVFFIIGGRGRGSLLMRREGEERAFSIEILFYWNFYTKFSICALACFEVVILS